MRMDRYMTLKMKLTQGHKMLKKYRISTTISMKHWALLKKKMDKYETQQKVLEHALENLDNDIKPEMQLSPEEEIWLLAGKVKSACLIQKDGYKVILETLDLERFTDYVNRQKPLEYVLEVYCQKPLKECALKEIIEAIVINGKISNQFDIIGYSDDVDHYTLKMTHDLGINNSRLLKIVYNSVFHSYGVKVEDQISERSLFLKIFKNEDT